MNASRGLSHAQYVLVNRLATPVGGLLILIIMGRHSDRLLGEYALVMTFYFVMQMLPLLGLTPYVMRETARKPDDAGKYFMSIGLVSLIGCVAVNLGCYAYLRAIHYEPPLPEAIGIVGALIFPGILLFVAELIFMSLHRARPVAQVAVVENAVRLAASGAVLWLDGGLIGVVWVFFGTRSAALAVYVTIMRRNRILRPGDRPDPAILRETLRVLPAFAIGAVLFVLVSRLDFLVLSIYQSVDVIGQYAIAYRVYDISINILTALVMALFPWTARKFLGARSHFRIAVRNMLVAFIAGLGLMCFAGVLLAEYYVLLLFPNQYPQPVVLTQLFVAALFVSGMDFVASGLLYAADRQGADTRAAALGAGVTTGLLFALVPRFGADGALVAKVATSVVQGALRFRAIDAAIGPLWHRGDIVGLVVMVAALAVLAVALLGAGLVLKLVAIVLTATLLLPAMAAALGLFRPARLLRYHWHSRGRAHHAVLARFADVVVADLRRHDRISRRRPPCRRGTPSKRALGALLFARLAHFLQPQTRLARIARWASRRLTPPGLAGVVGADEAAIIVAVQGRFAAARDGHRP